jgi:hypothetical protein
MYSIVFVKGNGNSGGIGDRIVGIFNIITFAKIFKQDFSIIWDFDISPIFKDTNMYHSQTLSINKNNYVDMFNSGNHVKWSKILETCLSCPFPKENAVYFRSNITTSQYLYRNPLYSSYNYEEDIMNLYKSIYKDIFIPTDRFLEIVNKEDNDMTGIQIRTGDFGFYDDQRRNLDKYNPVKDDMITTILHRIKNHVNNDNKVYITSDNKLVIEKAKEIFKNISYNYEAIVHIDISNDRNLHNITNLFVDHYILSKKCNRLYISDFSNFGVSIALCSDSNEMYNLRCEKIDDVCKKELLYGKKKFVM